MFGVNGMVISIFNATSYILLVTREPGGVAAGFVARLSIVTPLVEQPDLYHLLAVMNA